MILPDVNVLVYAYDSRSPHHEEIREWLDHAVNSKTNYALTDLVLSSFLRIVTHPRILIHPSPLDRALQFVTTIRDQPNCINVFPGPSHWDIFIDLCIEAEVKGNLVPDTYLAALAIESGTELITTDRDFTRFPGLRWRHPLAPPR